MQLSAVSCVVAVLVGSAAMSPVAAETSFRVSDLDLRDPHMFVNIGICLDATEAGFNAGIQSRLNNDSDKDGNLDSSYLLTFMPLNQGAATNFLAAGPATCSAPAESTMCGAITDPWFGTDATLMTSGTCLTFVPGTVRPYTPAVASATGPCFTSPAQTFAIDIGGVVLMLRDAQLAATFNGNPATTLSNGLVRGFLTEADANATIIPASYPQIGGRPLSSVLPGGTGSCAPHDDRDTHGDASGWWFYFSYTAAEADGVTIFSSGFEAQ
jgi:hypothetical protein